MKLKQLSVFLENRPGSLSEPCRLLAKAGIKAIGRLLDELQRLDRERDTLVVVVADHGEGLDDHGELTHGFFLYETTLRVPLLMRYPGLLPQGKRVTALVRTIDIAPTILDLFGIAPPGYMDGKALEIEV